MARPAGSSKLLRAMNESAALAHLLDPGMLTRANLHELTALSTPTISEVLRRLTAAGLISVVGHNSGRPGPNAEIYSANPDAAWTAAISVRDIGADGTPSITGAICDLTGNIRARVESRVDLVPNDPMTAITNVIADLRARTNAPDRRIRHIQLGVPGSHDSRVPGFGRTGLVPAIAQRLGTHVSVDSDVNLAAIAERLGTHVGVDSDVNLAAIAERRRGVARNTAGFALIWLGQDGLGLAIDIGGTLIRGANGGAGDIGHMPLYAPDPTHRKITLQDLVGGRAIMALAREHHIQGSTPADAVSAAASSPRTSSEFFAQLADRVSVCLAAVVAVLDPPMVVLAGQVARAGGETLREAVSNAMVSHAAVPHATVPNAAVPNAAVPNAAVPNAAVADPLVADGPLEPTIALTGIDDDAVLLGALDAGLAAVREALLTKISDS